MVKRTLDALWRAEALLAAIPPRIKAILLGMIVLHLFQIYGLLPAPSL